MRSPSRPTFLPLNAAVESRPCHGEAGHFGFAVVADEVRSLSQRCAAAARETSDRISDSTVKSTQGAQMSEKVATNLSAIVERIRRLDEMVAEIAQASHEQSKGIAQVSEAVNGIDRITQSNAALSQQSAASAEELKTQAEEVRQEVAMLMSLVENSSSTIRFGEVSAPPVAPSARLRTHRASAPLPVTIGGNTRTRVSKPVAVAHHGTGHQRNGHAMPKGTVAAADFFSDDAS